MHIFELLKKDHKDVKALLERVSMASGRASATRKRTFDSVAEMIEAHMAGEERVFYARLQRHYETRVSAIEAIEEHKIGKQLLRELRTGNVDSDQWQGKFKAFRSIIEHHIEEEEEHVFDECEDLFDDSDFEEMGNSFTEEKRRFLATGTSSRAGSGRTASGRASTNRAVRRPARSVKPQAKRRRVA
ncbi:MAG: hemerythrin domain-containing protein [Oligoflexia bacterium]|nr:hemerythrin domain-containing protein [Oligoflexia bacterium]